MRASWSVSCACALLVCLTGVSVQAGVVVEVEQRLPGTGAVIGRTTYHFDVGRLRVESTSEEGEQVVVIFRSDRKTAWLINQGEGTYVELTPAKVVELKKKLDAQQQEMAAELAKLPPEQRKAMEEMMAAVSGPEAALSFNAVGRDEKVDSYTCTRYEALEGESRVAEIWTASLDQLQLSAEEYEPLREMGRMMEPLGASRPLAQLMQTASLEGVPVRTVSYADGVALSEDRVVSAERKTLEARLFELPRGLRKVEPGEE
ncbi:MAG TPA: DUF4412 domain-containing protein [Candidatus Acidoferrales bacterium]